jgi:hypothetical protein
MHKEHSSETRPSNVTPQPSQEADGTAGASKAWAKNLGETIFQTASVITQKLTGSQAPHTDPDDNSGRSRAAIEGNTEAKPPQSPRPLFGVFPGSPPPSSTSQAAEAPGGYPS